MEIARILHWHFLHIYRLYAGVMGCGAVEATDLGFVCFVVINLCVLSAKRVDFASPPSHTQKNTKTTPPLTELVVEAANTWSKAYILSLFTRVPPAATADIDTSWGGGGKIEKLWNTKINSVWGGKRRKFWGRGGIKTKKKVNEGWHILINKKYHKHDHRQYLTPQTHITIHSVYPPTVTINSVYPLHTWSSTVFIKASCLFSIAEIGGRRRTTTWWGGGG